jgi:hypothetical protein
MAHRDQEQEVNLQVQAGAHSYARLRLPQAGKQAIEPLLRSDFTIQRPSFFSSCSFFWCAFFFIMCSI